MNFKQAKWEIAGALILGLALVLSLLCWQTVPAVSSAILPVCILITAGITITLCRTRTDNTPQFLPDRDSLTLLYNRQTLLGKIQQSLDKMARNQERAAFILIDLDRFKAINESQGHQTGDKLLKIVASRLQSSLPDNHLLGRSSGDEFTILLENITPALELCRLAHTLTEQIAQPILIDGDEYYITCSIGISRFPEDARTLTNLMRNADVAMYQAKGDGKNTFRLHSKEEQQQLSAKNSLEARLHVALSRQQFTLLYQPQYDLEKGNYVGVEALIRWHHPELGMIPPASFIPLAEESGLIESIGNWVIHQSCRQIRAWLDAGIDPIQVAVNLSPRQFKRGILVDTIQSALDESGLSPERISVEVTEGIVMQNPQEAREILNELRQMGIRVAIDDFGSGYSSLAYLKQLPLDVLKIDRVFVTPLPEDKDSIAIVEAMIVMARKLGLSVIAEGVENSQQAQFLRQIGCESVQGYHYSRPLAAEKLVTHLDSHRFMLEV